MPDHIKSYWDNQARRYQQSFEASWGDLNMIRLEIGNIGAFLRDDDAVLDVGCANGFAAFEHVNNGLESITGVDYSEPMIEKALAAARNKGLEERCRFQVADIQSLPFEDGSFDVVYTTRVLINLPSWEAQKKGISECLRVARSGGKVIFSEAFWEPLQRLNAIRVVAGLTPLQEPDFNRYLKEHAVEALLGEKALPFQIRDFSSLYYLGTRFLREIVSNPGATEGFDNPFNAEIFRLEREYSAIGFGIQKAYVISKP